MNKLSCNTLKNSLWDVLNKIHSDQISPLKANAIATQAREILRTTQMQLKIAQQAKKKLSKTLVDFGD